MYSEIMNTTECDKDEEIYDSLAMMEKGFLRHAMQRCNIVCLLELNYFEWF